MNEGDVYIIVLNKYLSKVERRCTLTHELAHYFLGHNDDYFETKSYAGACSYSKKEHDAWVWAVDRLVGAQELLYFFGSDHELTVEEIADYLWVTTEVLFFKIQRLVSAGYMGNFLLPKIT